MIAAKKCHINVIHELLAHPRTAVNAMNSNGHTALAMARAAQRIVVAQLLYRYGAEDFGREGLPPALANLTEAENEQRRRQMILEQIIASPLHRAAASGNLEELEINLRLNALDAVRETSLYAVHQALLYAAGRGHAQIVNRLLRAGADPREALEIIKTILQRPFLTPEERKQYEAIRTMLINRLPTLLQRITENPELHATLIGRFYDLPQERREALVSRNEQLILGIQAGRIDEVRAALQAEADPNARDARGNTAWWIAVLTGQNQEIIQLLVHHGADPTIPAEGQTLIQWAARRQNQQLVGDLLALGVRAPEEIIQTYLAGRLVPESALGRVEEVLRLISDPTIDQQERQTALLYAATQGHETIVRIIIRALGTPQPNVLKAVQAILRRRGLSPYDAAVYQEIARILVRAQQPARLERRPEDERLLHAIHNGSARDAAAALDAHANPNALDAEGRAAIEIAAQYKDTKKAIVMVKLLIERDAFPNPIVDLQGGTLLMAVINRPTIATLIVAELQRRGIIGALERSEIRGQKRLFEKRK